jgi:hypothetical protein
MQYFVWLRGFEVEARDPAEALAKACQKLREKPASYIGGVRFGPARKSNRGILWRLITGK